MHDFYVPITLDTERNLIFNLNVLEKCIDKYKNLNKILSSKNITELRWIAVQMLNEDAEIWNEEHPDNKKPVLTEKQLSRMIGGIGGINNFQAKVQEALLKGLPEDQVQEIEEMTEEMVKKTEKNLKAAQRKQR